MKDIITVDLTQVGREIGVPEQEFTPPFPGAKPMMQQVWDTEWVEKAIVALKKYKDEGARVSLFGHLDTWVCIAIADSLMPECECFFATPNHDPDNTFTNLPIYEVKFGEADPRLNYKQTVREEGDFLYLDIEAGQGVEWLDLLEMLKDTTIPDIPEGKNLCVYSSAMYPLQWVILNNYAKKSKSLFCAGHTDPAYRCALPGDSGYKLGDAVPRA